MSVFSFSGAVILIQLVTGCVVTPIPTTVEELPFSDEDIRFIVPGTTSRGQIEAAFGEPDIVRIDSKLAVYGKARRVAGLFGATMGKGSIAPIETLHLLAVRYDANQHVNAVDVLRLGTGALDDTDCTADGFCIEPRFESGRATSWIWDHEGSVLAKAIIFDNPQNDAAAKSFEADSNSCSLYAYHNESLLGNRDILVYRNAPHTEPVIMDEDGFLHWRNDPGLVFVSAGVIPRQESSSVRVKGDMQKFEFPCDAGKQYFIEIDLREGWFKFVLEISLDDRATGLAAVRGRRLMLDF